MAVNSEKAGQLVTESAPLSQQQDVETSICSWHSSEEQEFSGTTNSSSHSHLPALSDHRGISQVLPDAIQEGLQHAIFISSSGASTLDLDTGAPPIQVEQQVDVVTMESYEQDSEPVDSEDEPEVDNDLGEQIPDEEVAVGAMEVTVWSTEDQETPPMETEDMINQSSTSINHETSSDEEESGDRAPGEVAPPPEQEMQGEKPSAVMAASVTIEDEVGVEKEESEDIGRGQEGSNKVSEGTCVEEARESKQEGAEEPEDGGVSTGVSIPTVSTEDRRSSTTDPPGESSSQDTLTPSEPGEAEVAGEMSFSAASSAPVPHSTVAIIPRRHDTALEVFTPEEVEDTGRMKKGKSKKKAAITSRARDAVLDLFSQEEMGVAARPLPPHPASPLESVQLSLSEQQTEDSYQSSKPLFSSNEAAEHGGFSLENPLPAQPSPVAKPPSTEDSFLYDSGQEAGVDAEMVVLASPSKLQEEKERSRVTPPTSSSVPPTTNKTQSGLSSSGNAAVPAKTTPPTARLATPTNKTQSGPSSSKSAAVSKVAPPTARLATPTSKTPSSIGSAAVPSKAAPPIARSSRPAKKSPDLALPTTRPLAPPTTSGQGRPIAQSTVQAPSTYHTPPVGRSKPPAKATTVSAPPTSHLPSAKPSAISAPPPRGQSTVSAPPTSRPPSAKPTAVSAPPPTEPPAKSTAVSAPPGSPPPRRGLNRPSAQPTTVSAPPTSRPPRGGQSGSSAQPTTISTTTKESTASATPTSPPITTAPPMPGWNTVSTGPTFDPTPPMFPSTTSPLPAPSVPTFVTNSVELKNLARSAAWTTARTKPSLRKSRPGEVKLKAQASLSSQGTGSEEGAWSGSSREVPGGPAEGGEGSLGGGQRSGESGEGVGSEGPGVRGVTGGTVRGEGVSGVGREGTRERDPHAEGVRSGGSREEQRSKSRVSRKESEEDVQSGPTRKDDRRPGVSHKEDARSKIAGGASGSLDESVASSSFVSAESEDIAARRPNHGRVTAVPTETVYYTRQEADGNIRVQVMERPGPSTGRGSSRVMTPRGGKGESSEETSFSESTSFSEDLSCSEEMSCSDGGEDADVSSSEDMKLSEEEARPASPFSEDEREADVSSSEDLKNTRPSNLFRRGHETALERVGMAVSQVRLVDPRLERRGLVERGVVTLGTKVGTETLGERPEGAKVGGMAHGEREKAPERPRGHEVGGMALRERGKAPSEGSVGHVERENTSGKGSGGARVREEKGVAHEEPGEDGGTRPRDSMPEETEKEERPAMEEEDLEGTLIVDVEGSQSPSWAPVAAVCRPTAGGEQRKKAPPLSPPAVLPKAQRQSAAKSLPKSPKRAEKSPPRPPPPSNPPRKSQSTKAPRKSQPMRSLPKSPPSKVPPKSPPSKALPKSSPSKKSSSSEAPPKSPAQPKSPLSKKSQPSEAPPKSPPSKPPSKSPPSEAPPKSPPSKPPSKSPPPRTQPSKPPSKSPPSEAPSKSPPPRTQPKSPSSETPPTKAAPPPQPRRDSNDSPATSPPPHHSNTQPPQQAKMITPTEGVPPQPAKKTTPTEAAPPKAHPPKQATVPLPPGATPPPRFKRARKSRPSAALPPHKTSKPSTFQTPAAQPPQETSKPSTFQAQPPQQAKKTPSPSPPATQDAKKITSPPVPAKQDPKKHAGLPSVLSQEAKKPEQGTKGLPPAAQPPSHIPAEQQGAKGLPPAAQPPSHTPAEQQGTRGLSPAAQPRQGSARPQSFNRRTKLPPRRSSPPLTANKSTEKLLSIQPISLLLDNPPAPPPRGNPPTPSPPSPPPPKKKVLTLKKQRISAAKDSTGEITMGTPHYSLNPCQEAQLDAVTEERDPQPSSVPERSDPGPDVIVLDTVEEGAETDRDQVPSLQPPLEADVVMLGAVGGPELNLVPPPPSSPPPPPPHPELQLVLDPEPRPVEVEVVENVSHGSREEEEEEEKVGSSPRHRRELACNQLAPATTVHDLVLEPLQQFIPISQPIANFDPSPPPPAATAAPPVVDLKHEPLDDPTTASTVATVGGPSSSSSAPSHHAPHSPEAKPTPTALTTLRAGPQHQDAPLHIRSIIHSHYIRSAMHHCKVTRRVPLGELWSVDT